MNKTPRGKSIYLGVYYNGKHIRTVIKIGSQRISLGNFKTEEEAAKRYDRIAKRFHGRFANLNFKEL
jgi:hypothetical protein